MNKAEYFDDWVGKNFEDLTKEYADINRDDFYAFCRDTFQEDGEVSREGRTWTQGLSLSVACMRSRGRRRS